MEKIETAETALSDAELLAMASAFEIVPWIRNRRVSDPLPMSVTRRSSDPEAWAISRLASVLNRDFEWEIEPMPSNRDADFLARTRWPSAKSAIAFARTYLASYTGQHDRVGG